ncbi:uncharacterized protein LOC115094455 isoform X2 [Rhinatrema bivittatum]|uniref:uncharacterized protein LOC115094455 isoform X2 n=1 Tax=Rhinatrema bivittatum TaxID=194408 RepID=UPI0011283B06|nr:uncharacterized protein LOC115094455 isoform X2 [Rhinatrema bivittatum]
MADQFLHLFTTEAPKTSSSSAVTTTSPMLLQSPWELTLLNRRTGAYTYRSEEMSLLHGTSGNHAQLQQSPSAYISYPTFCGGESKNTITSNAGRKYKKFQAVPIPCLYVAQCDTSQSDRAATASPIGNFCRPSQSSNSLHMLQVQPQNVIPIWGPYTQGLEQQVPLSDGTSIYIYDYPILAQLPSTKIGHLIQLDSTYSNVDSRGNTNTGYVASQTRPVLVLKEIYPTSSQKSTVPLLASYSVSTQRGGGWCAHEQGSGTRVPVLQTSYASQHDPHAHFIHQALSVTDTRSDASILHASLHEDLPVQSLIPPLHQVTERQDYSSPTQLAALHSGDKMELSAPESKEQSEDAINTTEGRKSVQDISSSQDSHPSKEPSLLTLDISEIHQLLTCTTPFCSSNCYIPLRDLSESQQVEGCNSAKEGLEKGTEILHDIAGVLINVNGREKTRPASKNPSPSPSSRPLPPPLLSLPPPMKMINPAIWKVKYSRDTTPPWEKLVYTTQSGEKMTYPIHPGQKVAYPIQLGENIAFPVQLRENRVYPIQLDNKIVYPIHLEEEMANLTQISKKIACPTQSLEKIKCPIETTTKEMDQLKCLTPLEEKLVNSAQAEQKLKYPRNTSSREALHSSSTSDMIDSGEKEEKNILETLVSSHAISKSKILDIEESSGLKIGKSPKKAKQIATSLDHNPKHLAKKIVCDAKAVGRVMDIKNTSVSATLKNESGVDVILEQACNSNKWKKSGINDQHAIKIKEENSCSGIKEPAEITDSDNKEPEKSAACIQPKMEEKPSTILGKQKKVVQDQEPEVFKMPQSHLSLHMFESVQVFHRLGKKSDSRGDASLSGAPTARNPTKDPPGTTLSQKTKAADRPLMGIQKDLLFFEEPKSASQQMSSSAKKMKVEISRKEGSCVESMRLSAWVKLGQELRKENVNRVSGINLSNERPGGERQGPKAFSLSSNLRTPVTHSFETNQNPNISQHPALNLHLPASHRSGHNYNLPIPYHHVPNHQLASYSQEPIRSPQGFISRIQRSGNRTLLNSSFHHCPLEELEVSVPIPAEHRKERETMKRKAQLQREISCQYTSMGKLQFFVQREKDHEISRCYGYPEYLLYITKNYLETD